MSVRRCIGILAVVLSTFGAAGAESGRLAQRLDVPYEPTPYPVVAAMLRIANAGPQDIVYDLGSGDGRIVVAAVRDFGVRKAVGVDIDPYRVQQGRENAERAGVADRAQFTEGDVFRFDFSEATVLTMYLFPSVNRDLRPRILDELKPGTRVVSHRFHMGEWEPDETVVVDDRHIYFFLVPAKVGGRWQWTAGASQYQIDLKQEFQKLSGTLSVQGRSARIENARMAGERLRFEARTGGTLLRFDGKVAGDTIEGAVEGPGGGQVVLRRAP